MRQSVKGTLCFVAAVSVGLLSASCWSGGERNQEEFTDDEVRQQYVETIRPLIPYSDLKCTIGQIADSRWKRSTLTCSYSDDNANHHIVAFRCFTVPKPRQPKCEYKGDGLK
jgi:hypothetical protein